MTLEPLLRAAPAIQIHATAILGAIALTLPQLALRKGTPLHRAVGWTWVVLIVVACLSSFFVHTIRVIGPFSPIHGLSVVTLVSVVAALFAARRGDVTTHRWAMLLVVVGGLVIAGGFTLLPGRIMHDVVVGGAAADVPGASVQVSDK